MRSMPMFVRCLPNVLSIIRLFCAPVIFWHILYQKNDIALYWVMFAFFTDFLDGWLARTYQLETALGRFLDPLADKVLSFCVFSALCISQKISVVLCLVVVLRDVCIGLGAWWIRQRKGEILFQPAMISKINTVVQGLLAVAVLWGKIPFLQDVLSLTLWVTTLMSFFIYYKMLVKCL